MNQEPRWNAWKITLVVISSIVFMLLFVALLNLFNTKDYSVIFKFDKNARALIIIGIILLIILFIVFVRRSRINPQEEDSTLMKPSFLGIDFSEKKKPLKSVDIEIDESKLFGDEESEGLNEVEDIEAEEEEENKTSEKIFIQVNPISTRPSPILENSTPTISAENDEDELEEDEKPSPTGKSRFYKLTELEEKYKNYKKPEYNNDISLKEICEQFRLFAASDTSHLYYSIEDIRRFIGGMAVTKLLILQGMSGTGKTSIAVNFGKFLMNNTKVIPIQPMWKERTDLIGYYNEFTKKFNETVLLQKLYEANYNNEIYITVLDEMNIARVEYYFAEFLSLLELPNPEKRYLDVVSDEWVNDPKLLVNGQLKLPKNMWFIGTANNDDSTFAISDKVYDRAMVINLDKKAKPFEMPVQNSVKVSASHLEDLYEKARKEYSISERNQRRIRVLDKYLIETFHITFGNRIMKQIKAYVPVVVACGGTELEALDDILSKKVLRKLEAKNPVYVKNASNGLIAFIDDLFGMDKMPLCKEYIINFEQNA